MLLMGRKCDDYSYIDSFSFIYLYVKKKKQHYSPKGILSTIKKATEREKKQYSQTVYSIFIL